MLITVNLAVIFILVCFIGGIIMGVVLVRPRQYGNYRGYSSTMRRHEE